MKNFFKGVKDLILRHKLLSIICFLAFIIVLILFYMFCSIFIGGSDKYGHRLDGIDEVMITKSDMSSVKEKIEEDENVSSANVRLQGKIIYIDIIFGDDVSVDKAKDIAKKVLENFDEDEINFYDFGFVLSQDKEDGFNITGAKSPKKDDVSFIKS